MQLKPSIHGNVIFVTFSKRLPEKLVDIGKVLAPNFDSGCLPLTQTQVLKLHVKTKTFIKKTFYLDFAIKKTFFFRRDDWTTGLIPNILRNSIYWPGTASLYIPSEACIDLVQNYTRMPTPSQIL